MGKKTVLILLFLSALLLMVSCSDEEPPEQTTAVVSDPVVTTPWTTPEVEKEETPVNLSYALATNQSEDGITVPSASFVSGTLLVINEETSFRYKVASLLPANQISSSTSRSRILFVYTGTNQKTIC